MGLPSNSNARNFFNLALSITYTTITQSPLQRAQTRHKSCLVFIQCNEKQGEKHAKARITAPTPTKNKYQTNAANNESNNINSLWQTTTSDLPAAPSLVPLVLLPSCSSAILNTQDCRKHLRKLEFKVSRCRAGRTGRNLVDKSHSTFNTQKLFSRSQKCQDSVTGYRKQLYWVWAVFFPGQCWFQSCKSINK